MLINQILTVACILITVYQLVFYKLNKTSEINVFLSMTKMTKAIDDFNNKLLDFESLRDNARLYSEKNLRLYIFNCILDIVYLACLAFTAVSTTHWASVCFIISLTIVSEIIESNGDENSADKRAILFLICKCICLICLLHLFIINFIQ